MARTLKIPFETIMKVRVMMWMPRFTFMRRGQTINAVRLKVADYANIKDSYGPEVILEDYRVESLNGFSVSTNPEKDGNRIISFPALVAVTGDPSVKIIYTLKDVPRRDNQLSPSYQLSITHYHYGSGWDWTKVLYDPMISSENQIILSTGHDITVRTLVTSRHHIVKMRCGSVPEGSSYRLGTMTLTEGYLWE